MGALRKMRYGRYALIVMALAALLVVLSSCGRGKYEARQGVGDERPGAPSAEAPVAADAVKEAAYSDAEGGEETATSAAAAGITRHIIMTGQLRLEVADLTETIEKVRKLAEEIGGYLAGSNVYETSEGLRAGEVTLRVPAEEFAAVFAQLKKLGSARSYSEDSQDVTEEWVDLEARIANKKAEEKSILALLERKGELEDILQVQREVFRVRGEVEQMEGRLRYLKNQVSLSTITVSIDELGPAGVAQPEMWRIGYHVRTAWNALTRLIEGAVYAVVYVVISGAIFWVPVVLLVLWLRRRRARRKAQQVEAGEA